MRLLSKLATRINRAVLATVLIGIALVPLTGLITPATASASACEYTGGGGGGAGGSPPLINLEGHSVSLDSTVNKVGFEFSPQSNWNANNLLDISGIGLADSGCASLSSSVQFSLDHSGKLTMFYYDNNRSAVFVSSTDYNVIDGGVTATVDSNIKSMSATYTFPTILASTTDVISVDLTTDAGFVDVFAKSGSGTDTKLINFKSPTGTTSFYGNNGKGIAFQYSAIDQTQASCTAITGSNELLVHVLAGGVGGTPVVLSATPDIYAACNNFDKTSYDSSTKTASLKYDVAGVSPNHVIKLTSDQSSLKAKTTDSYIDRFTSIAVSTDHMYFTDYFNSGSSASQPLYFTTSESQDGKSLPKSTPWPIAGGVFDMSSKDVDLAAGGVVFDTSLSGHAAVAHNMNKVTKDGTFTLFIPYKDKDNYVGLCAGAADLSAVGNKCSGIYYLKDGQTKKNSDTKSIPVGHSVKASIVTVGVTKFWQVEGLTGTGGFSTTLVSDPATGISVSATSTPAVVAVVFATIVLAFAARRYATVKK